MFPINFWMVINFMFLTIPVVIEEVGVLYKETLPLIIRDDLSFNESIVVELHFGKKTLFFTVIYRSPSYKDGSPEFEKILYEII